MIVDPISLCIYLPRLTNAIMTLRSIIPVEAPVEESARDFSLWSRSIPLRERLLDRMGDLLFCAEDLLDILREDPERHRFADCELPLQAARDSIDGLMKALCD